MVEEGLKYEIILKRRAIRPANLDDVRNAIQWCIANTGQYETDWDMKVGSSLFPKEGNLTSFRFLFRHETDAILFKLTWS